MAVQLDIGIVAGNGPRPVEVQKAIDLLSASTNGDERGAVFTRQSVVDFILDLAGYASDRPLHRLKALEPSCGHGDFLLPMVSRLLETWTNSNENTDPEVLVNAIRAVELHQDSITETKDRLRELLSIHGIRGKHADRLIDAWLIHDDFLLTTFPDGFDFIVGNPPYLRQEAIPDVLLAEYRSLFKTMYDRADLYIAFIERSLGLLDDDGTLCFICSDRWTKNKYGGPLRELVASKYHLKAYIDMVGTDAFHDEVTAYPAIVAIRNGHSGTTAVAKPGSLDEDTLRRLRMEISDLSESPSVIDKTVLSHGRAPWILSSDKRTTIIRHIEERFPLLEDAGCRVGIGVATGADKAFIGPFDDLDVEPDRKLPLVQTKDIVSGEMVWRGSGIVNPFSDDGSLIKLEDYPRMKQYLEDRKDVIAKRHCARKVPANWYRTIDKIHAQLTWTPKLLIPDIKGNAHVVHEKGDYYPHHNLYYVLSSNWSLRELQGVLLSTVAKAFIACYSTRMRGGYLRFQAQYLRRIRLPEWDTVSDDARSRLVQAATARDISACDEVVASIYGLDATDMRVLREWV